MNQYQLQPYHGPQSRYHCPECDHRTKTFSRYINIETGEELAPHVGRCDREDKCGYHLKPYNYLREIGALQISVSNRTHYQKKRTPARKHQPKKSDPKTETEYYIHSDYVNDSFTHYGHNNFVQYLINRFGLDIADELVSWYRIGTSSYWHGATVFWQLDTHGYTRTGKIMLYDKQTGKRVKEPFNHITWAHTVLSSSSRNTPEPNTATATTTATFQLKQCLFGEHLLITSPYKPVAVVESEKTAIIASVLMPAFIWLACGSLQGLSVDKCRILQGRKVMLFPDVNACSKWKIRSLELRRALPGTTFAVSAELESLATEQDRKDGVDVGDVVY